MNNNDDKKPKDDLAMDGLVRELNRAGDGDDETLIKRIMDSVIKFYNKQLTYEEVKASWGKLLHPKTLRIAASIILIPVLLIAINSAYVYSTHANPTELYIISQKYFSPDTAVNFRVYVRNGRTLEPIANKQVEIILTSKKTKTTLKKQVKTDPRGVATIELETGNVTIGDYKVEAVSDTIKAVQNITVQRSYKTYLTTDKPTYKPGQTIHIRSLTLNNSTLKPESKTGATLEISDPNGNLVFKETKATSDYGITSYDFLLAEQVLLGPYTLKATIGDTVTERQVTVKHYKLPKYKVSFDTSKGFYEPGETIKGTLQADYVFGKPVHNAAVTITTYDFIEKFTPFATFAGQTDDNGHLNFSIALKDYFTGTELNKKDAFCKLEAHITDSAGQQQTISKKLIITNTPIRIDIVQGNKRLLPDFDNPFYIFTYYPNGQAAETSITINGKRQLKTSTSGIATFNYKLNNKEDTITIVAKDKRGLKAVRHLKLNSDEAQNSFILQTDKSVYKTGETIVLKVHANDSTGTVFVDFVKDKRCVLMKSIDLKENHGILTFDIPSDLYGTLQLHAYRIPEKGNMISDLKLIQVTRRADLNITTKLNKNVYKPGENAIIQFLVRNPQNEPVQTALSISVVDEAVFALFEMQPGFERIYFMLQEKLLKPQYQIKAATTIFPDKPESAEAYQTKTDMLLSQAKDVNNPSFNPSQLYPERERKYVKEKRTYSNKLSLGICLMLILVLLTLSTPFMWLTLRNIFELENCTVINKISEKNFKQHVIDITMPWLAILFTFLAISGSFLIKKEFIPTTVAAQPTSPWKVCIIIITLLTPFFFLKNYRKKIKLLLANFQEVTNYHKCIIFLPWVYFVFIFINCYICFTILFVPQAPYMIAIGIFMFFANLLIMFGIQFNSYSICSQETLKARLSVKENLQHLGDGLGGSSFAEQTDHGCLLYLLCFLLYAPILILALSIIITVLSLFLPLISIVECLGSGDSGGSRTSFMQQTIEERPFENINKLTFINNDKTYTDALPVRIRKHFPETLLWRPELITDNNGKASLTLPLADSITTWRMGLNAISKQGLMGFKKENIQVFQDFFVDIDPPLALLQNDEVSIPVVIYNYLKTEQTVNFEYESSAKIIRSKAIKSLLLKPNEVKSCYLPIKAIQPGMHTLTVKAYTSKTADAIERHFRVVADGQKVEKTINKIVQDKANFEFSLPKTAISNSDKCYLTLYPSPVSEMISSLNAMLRQPYGCCEQTSSITYPNIMILNYLRKSKQATPALEMKALKHIKTGYQRLLTFESKGGGFDWFGRSPANIALSAYGLMEFCELRNVITIDDKIIDRTRNWLYNKQSGDGSWRYSGKMFYNYSPLTTTAYITWAIAQSGHRSNELAKAVEYIISASGNIKEPYTLALCANALYAYNHQAQANRILKQLLKSAIKDKDSIHWNAGTRQGIFYSYGNTANIITTAMICQAMQKNSDYSSASRLAINWLIKQRSSNGWGSTEATIQTLKAITLGTGHCYSQIDKKTVINIKMNNKLVKSIKLTPSSKQILHTIDCKPYLQRGRNILTVSSSPKASMSYQANIEYYLPHTHISKPQDTSLPLKEHLDIQVSYNKDKLNVHDILEASVYLKYQGRAKAYMTLVDLGIPPGFSVLEDAFQKLIDNQTIERYSITGQQVILYFRELQGGKPLMFKYQLRAKYPVKIKTPTAKAYQYYTPEINAESQAATIQVEGGNK